MQTHFEEEETSFNWPLPRKNEEGENVAWAEGSGPSVGVFIEG